MFQHHERPVPGFGSLVGGSVRIDRELVDGDVIVPGGAGRRTCRWTGRSTISRGSMKLFVQGGGGSTDQMNLARKTAAILDLSFRR